MKRLRSGKYIETEKASEISGITMRNLYDTVKKQFIISSGLPEEFGEKVQKLNSYGYAILRIGQEMDAYYKAVSGEYNLNERKVDLGEILSNLYSEAEPHLANAGFGLAIKRSEESIYVKIDTEKFYYALLEVLVNAVEHSEKGSKIKITAVKSKKFVKITLGNRGKPMDEETLQNCFEPFFVSPEKTGERKLGLGLTLAHFFFTQSKGRINIRSSNNSTEVSMLLPLDFSEEKALSVASTEAIIGKNEFSPVKIMLYGMENMENNG